MFSRAAAVGGGVAVAGLTHGAMGSAGVGAAAAAAAAVGVVGAHAAKRARSASITATFATVAVKVSGKQVNGFVLRNDPEFRVHFHDDAGGKISPWHDIPAFPQGKPTKGKPVVVNFVTEIPRHSVEKMEIATKEPHNPIKQDIKKEKLRQYPFQSLVNYGAIPQTWEDPTHKDKATGLAGDNDPLDVCEIGSRVSVMGEVRPVKVLGILGMIDEGEMDWKVIAIDTQDPHAAKLNDVGDVEKHMPGLIDSIVNWFKMYKVPDGKPENQFAFDGKAQGVDFAADVIADCHDAWKRKDAMKAKGLWLP